MSNETTTRAPADVRERVKEPTQALSNGDDPAALLRTPRGEGEAEPVAWRVEFRPRGEIEWRRLGTYDYPDIAEGRALILSSSGRMECRIVPLYPAVPSSELATAHPTDRSESDVG